MWQDEVSIKYAVRVSNSFAEDKCEIENYSLYCVSCRVPFVDYQKCFDTSGHGVMGHADSNLQTFPPAHDIRGKMASSFRPPHDADGMHLCTNHFSITYVSVLDGSSEINLKNGIFNLQCL